MPVVKVVNFDGQSAGEMNLSDKVFAAPINIAVMHQVVVAHLANCRQGNASVKTRGEVSGGGKKPWRQKHTGRARQGSTRSPLWIHGGVAHGPKVRDYSQKVNKKVKRLALLGALSVKARDDLLFIVKGMNFDAPSTKKMQGFLNAVDAGKKVLVIYHESCENLLKSVRNIEGAKCINVGNINVYDLLNANKLFITPEVAARLEEVYSR